MMIVRCCIYSMNGLICFGSFISGSYMLKASVFLNIHFPFFYTIIDQPEETVFEPFAQYAEMAGLTLMIVPKGFELTPPQINANDNDADEDDNGSDDDDVWSMRDNTINRLEANNDDLDAWG